MAVEALIIDQPDEAALMVNSLSPALPAHSSGDYNPRSLPNISAPKPFRGQISSFGKLSEFLLNSIGMQIAIGYPTSFGWLTEFKGILT